MSNVQVKHCATTPHIGETLTINYLKHNLPDGTLLVNYYLPDLPNTLEIDVVVLNRNGVYLLEVKHWHGPIEADQVSWRRDNGELHPSPIPIIEHKAKCMHGSLGNTIWRNVSVVGLVILSKGTTALEIEDPNAHKVFGLHKDLIEALTGPEYTFHPRCRKLTNAGIERLCSDILKTHVTDAGRCVAGYRVLSELDCEHYVELVAQDPEFSQRQVRIKQYDVPAIGSMRELKRAVNHFKREMSALLEAGLHPNLVTPHQFCRDESSDERYYLILERTGDQTLADRITMGPIEIDEQLRILSDVAAALVHCHAHGVYHRNLSPSSVYLTPEGRAKIGDFDFAKVPTISLTLSQTTKRLLAGRHLAPEQVLLVPDVDQRADIFALGSIWYDMLFRPQPDEILDRSRIADAPLSDDGKKILSKMVEEHRSNRPQSVEEIQQWLALPR